MPPISSAMTMKRIHREISDLKKEELGGMTLGPTEESLFNWRGSIPGPEGSCYEGGLFWLEIVLPPDYPGGSTFDETSDNASTPRFSAPRVTFTTRIYHMNISDRGSVCIDLLKNNWSPALSLYKVLLSLSSLLTDPNPKDPLVPQIASQYIKDRAQYEKAARRWTQLYALRPSVSSSSKTLASAAVSVSSSSVTASSSRQSASSSEEVVIIDDSPERPSRKRRERNGSVAEGRRKRTNHGQGRSSDTGESSFSPDVIIIDD